MEKPAFTSTVDNLSSPITIVSDANTGEIENKETNKPDNAIFDYNVLNNKNHDVFSADQEKVGEEVPVSRSEMCRRNFLNTRVPKLCLNDDGSEQVDIPIGTGVERGESCDGGGNEDENDGSGNSDGTNNSITHVESDFLQTDTSRKSVRLTSALLHYVRPEGLNLVALGSSQSLDAFARLNNGIRRSLIDMYNMVDTMRRQVHNMRTPVVKMFFSWWSLFASFLTTSLDAYNYVLLPWITARKDNNHSIDFPATLKSIDETVKLFANIRSHVARRAPDETIARIIRALENLATFPRFLQDIEDQLPELVDQCDPRTIQEQDFIKLHRRVLKYLHHHGATSDKRRFHILLIERGMNLEEVSAWKPMVPFYIRLAAWTYKTKFEKKYMGFLREIC